MIPIVLTGTIAPNTLPVVHRDPQQRGREYRDAIQHYLGVGPVYFLENSGSPLLDDPFFSATPGLQTVRFPPSLGTRQGKGYQEFEMLDAFVSKTLAADARSPDATSTATSARCFHGACANARSLES